MLADAASATLMPLFSPRHAIISPLPLMPFCRLRCRHYADIFQI
jgi:hypothetical protein